MHPYRRMFEDVVHRFRGAVEIGRSKRTFHSETWGEGLKPFALTNTKRSEVFALTNSSVSESSFNADPV